MVSLGTIISIGVVGTAILGGYALYRNSNKIGGALSRGVEKNLTTPFGNYFDNLWKGVNVNSSNTSKSTQAAQQKFNRQIEQKKQQQQRSLVPTMREYEKVTDTNDNPQKFNPANGINNKTNPYGYEKLNTPKPGYYYINYQGSKYDTQMKLTSNQAIRYQKLAGQGALENIHYTGKKLSPAGLKLFARSRNYL